MDEVSCAKQLMLAVDDLAGDHKLRLVDHDHGVDIEPSHNLFDDSSRSRSDRYDQTPRKRQP